MDGFGATPEQEQDDQTIRLIVSINRATIEYERHRTSLDLEAGCIIWSIKRLIYRGPLSVFVRSRGARKPQQDRRTQPTRTAVAGITHARKHTLESRKGNVNGNADFLSRLPLPATERDRTGRSRLTPSDEQRVFLIRSHDLLLGGPFAMNVGLGWLAPSDTEFRLRRAPALPTLFFYDFRKHGSRMRVDDLDSSSGEFAACAPPHFTPQGTNWTFLFNTWASDSIGAPVLAVLVAPLTALAGGVNLGQIPLSKELAPPLPQDSDFVR